MCGTAGGAASVRKTISHPNGVNRNHRHPIAQPKRGPRIWRIAGQHKVLRLGHWHVIWRLGGEGASVEVGGGQGHAQRVVVDGVSRDGLWAHVDAPELVEGVEVDLEGRQDGDGGHGEREKGQCLQSR